MNLIILGPPGSGKGTYASRLKTRLKTPAIASGDIFRELATQKSQLAGKVRSYMNRGELIPDDIANKIMRERLGRDDCRTGFLLDGYPRTIRQAKSLDGFAKVDAVIHLVVPEWIVIKRLSSRRVCDKCGEVYNILFLKPKREGVCDVCGGKLIQREDDMPKVIKERLKVYERQTQPLLEFYKNKTQFVKFKCNKIDIPPEVAVEEIFQGIKRLNIDKTVTQS